MRTDAGPGVASADMRAWTDTVAGLQHLSVVVQHRPGRWGTSQHHPAALLAFPRDAGRRQPQHRQRNHFFRGMQAPVLARGPALEWARNEQI